MLVANVKSIGAKRGDFSFVSDILIALTVAAKKKKFNRSRYYAGLGLILHNQCATNTAAMFMLSS